MNISVGDLVLVRSPDFIHKSAQDAIDFGARYKDDPTAELILDTGIWIVVDVGVGYISKHSFAKQMIKVYSQLGYGWITDLSVEKIVFKKYGRTIL